MTSSVEQDRASELLPDQSVPSTGRYPADASRRRGFSPRPPASLRGLGPVAKACVGLDASVPTVPIDACQLRNELPSILSNRLSPLALDLLRRSGRSGFGASYDTLQSDAFRLNARTVELLRNTAPALEALNNSNIRFLVMKGPATAGYYRSRAHRPYSDIDVLVHPVDFNRTVAVLDLLGYTAPERSRPPWEWFRTSCVEGVNFQNAHGGAIDVHHHLSPWAFTKELQFDVLHGSSKPGNISGVPVRYLGAEHAFVVAALHVLNDLWKGDPSLISWRDLGVLYRHLGPAAVESAFERAGLSWFLPYITETLAIFINVGPLPSRRPNIRYGFKYARLYALGWHKATFTARHPAGWALRLPALRAAAFLAGWTIPSASYVERHGGYLSYWSELARTVVSVARGADLRRA